MSKSNYKDLMLAACRHQCQALYPLCFAVCLPMFGVYALMVFLCFLTGTPVSYFVDDPAEAGRQPFYTGLFSQLGAVLWASTSAVCLFSAALLWQRSAQRSWSWFLGTGSLVTAVLLFDDLFLLHEEFFPEYIHLPQVSVQTAYGLMLVIFFAYFRNHIKDTEFLLLLFALGGFGLSFILDLFATDFEGRKTIEEGFKWLGISSWTAYFIRICFQQLKIGADHLE